MPFLGNLGNAGGPNNQPQRTNVPQGLSQMQRSMFWNAPEAMPAPYTPSPPPMSGGPEALQQWMAQEERARNAWNARYNSAANRNSRNAAQLAGDQMLFDYQNEQFMYDQGQQRSEEEMFRNMMNDLLLQNTRDEMEWRNSRRNGWRGSGNNSYGGPMGMRSSRYGMP